MVVRGALRRYLKRTLGEADDYAEAGGERFFDYHDV
jgi:hypothetical protein